MRVTKIMLLQFTFVFSLLLAATFLSGLCAEGADCGATVAAQTNNGNGDAEPDEEVPTGSGPFGTAEELDLPRVSAGQGQLARVLGIVFMFTGLLATIFIIVGGFRYVLSAGSPDATQQAKNTILYAVIGLVISIFAYTIVNFVISRL